MKKFVLGLTAFFMLTGAAFSSSDGSTLFTNELSLGTGASIHNESSCEERKNLLSTSDYKRIITGITFTENLNISQPIKIIFGGETFFDFIWNKGSYYNTIDYSFFSGIKVFTGISGLNVSIAYVLGNRTDFYTLAQTSDGATPKKSDTKSWGNGFKLNVQYDFMQEKAAKFKPILGGYYRFVPRGNYSTDHVLCIYGGIRF